MHSADFPKQSPAPIAIVGMACRLPGAPDVGAFWDLMKRGGCSVTEIGNDRWHRERFWHPRASEAGFSYSFAAGLIDDPFMFDPAAFGISPREAEQMDPQQRLLLELVWEALEDAGIPPSTLQGTGAGVFVGASSLDYGSRQMTDPASIDAHFMAGNTLSIVANRISYIYGLNGPSFTVDTACSSSLVALNQALLALDSGAVDTAIVAGVNVIASPFSFIGFSRAGMLSPTGLCRPFAANADGYVRAEGGVVLILRAQRLARANGEQPRAMIVASAVNSDGHTSGLTLPSAEAQRKLLDRLYREHEIDPDKLAFVEAHGTGTRVGDPAEAHAIGRALGQRRGRPLPIGSVKSNIGHLEPASGLAGLLKAALSLQHRHLPASLHLDEPNPDIAFGELNLAPVHELIDLSDSSGPLHAGVSSFGFGGTNAHVVLRSPTAQERAVARKPKGAGAPEVLIISAQSPEALRALAGRYSEAMADQDAAAVASAAAHRRDLLGCRLALPVGDAAAMIDALARHGRGEQVPGIELAQAAERAAPVAFVYSGNGAQWAGMGRLAFARNAVFREQFNALDALHRRHTDWSLAEALHAGDLDERIKLTSIAQPLLFAIQSALTGALAELGLRPDAVLGHSVGEIAAAEACGALTREAAVELIHRRSQIQERARGLGLMLAARLSAAEAQDLIDDGTFAGLELAAFNSPTAVTLAGPANAIRDADKTARQRRISARVLALDYPFHSHLLTPLEAPFMASMAGFSVRAASIPFFSTVSGAALDGGALDGGYWWRNIREPVRFAEAVQAAAGLGCRVFVEIGPHPILLNNITDILSAIPGVASIASLDSAERTDKADPVRLTLARAAAHGANIDRDRVFGSRSRHKVVLPAYPWQRTLFRIPASSETVDIFGLRPRHPLIGARLTGDAGEWRNVVDPIVVPYLADHKVGGEIVMPAAGFAEMALAAARETLGEGPLTLEDFDIRQGLVFADGAMREIAVRLAGETRVVEILSRPRFSADWTLHARGRIGRPESGDETLRGPAGDDVIEGDAAEVYACAARFALDYGPQFRRVVRTRRDDKMMDVELISAKPGVEGFSISHVLSPIMLDAAFHSLFLICDAEEQRTYLPVRIGSLRVHASGAAIVRAMVRVDSHTERSLAVTIALLGNDGAVVAFAEDVRFQAVALNGRRSDVFFRAMPVRIAGDAAFDVRAVVEACLSELPAAAERGEDVLLLLAFVRSFAHRAMLEISDCQSVSLHALVDRGVLHEASLPLAGALLNILEQAGLATQSQGLWTLAGQCDLPSADVILKTLCADHPGRSAELVMAARALAGLDDVLRSGKVIVYPQALLDQFETELLLMSGGIKTADAMIRSIAWRLDGGPLRVLISERGGAPLIQMLLPLLRTGRFVATVVGTDSKRLAALEVRTGRMAGLNFVDLDDDGNALEALPPFDLGLTCGMRSLFGDDRKLGQSMARALRGSGALLAIQPRPGPILDLLLGVTADWFARSVTPDFPAGPLLDDDELREALNKAGFEAIELHSIAGPDTVVAVANPSPRIARAAGSTAPAAIFTNGPETRLASRLSRLLETTGRPVTQPTAVSDKASWAKAVEPICADAAHNADILHLATARLGNSAALGALIARIAAMLEGIRTANRRPRVWLVTRGAFVPGSNRDMADHEMAAAVWAFGRVAINEYPEIDLRLVDLSDEFDEADAAEKLAAVLARPGTETEIVLDRNGLSVVRATQDLPQVETPALPGAAARLHFAPAGSPERLEWRPVERVDPAAGEIEIAVAATGLNFRDVMYASGLLPDDILAEGFAGSTLGFECAGRVSRVGAKVTGLKPGDPVASFARNAFASHVTVPADIALPVPPSMPLEAAAGIPVAFLTAWYGLIHLARLKRNEWVLIHAAAGGVGLAAMQIARWRGARIVATAGSEEKRALVRLLGADIVLDSRSLAFADEIRKSIGGVDVVLNSLSGAAMEASLKTLKPFGRFVELGKRDYVANSFVGLRPFRRNLTYYGVDADQLLTQQRPLARKLTRELARRFAEGAFTPLPYRPFEAENIHDAFLSMQRAAHVGKLVVRPPRDMPPRRADTVFAARAEGCHLVVGGTSGFGFATAQWLADCGARTIVVASRRGALAPECEEAAAELRARGVELIAAHVDVTRRDSVDWLIHWIELQHGPLAGLVHAAMVLADGAMAELDETKIAQVLTPKIDGARHLDAATRHSKLDYFVLYSSATTLIGNPGQASYVAANGFLEGLARQRRAQKLPALAVAWGPIADTGVLARDAATGARLARRTGRAGLKARDALAALGRLLCRDGLALDEAAVGCAVMDWGAASRELKLLQAPLYSILRPDAGEVAADSIDVLALLRNKSEAEARNIVTDLIAQQVATILRVAVEGIDPRRPLSAIGMDSLMGLELKMAVERRFDVEVPLMALSAGKSIADIVTHMVSQLRPPHAEDPASDELPVAERGRSLLDQHGAGDPSAEEFDRLAEAVERRRAAMTRFSG